MTGNCSDPATLARRLIPPTTHHGRSEPVESRDSCGEFDIRIASDGTWFYHGSPITRKPLVKLFASVLRRDEAGDFWLVTPAERGRIRVDDAPFVAVELTTHGVGRDRQLIFRTNLDEIVTAGPDHHIRVRIDDGTGTPRPYIAVRPGLDALIARPVFYQLADLAVEDDPAGATGTLGVWSCGAYFALGRVD
jgi:uncharacterized protein